MSKARLEKLLNTIEKHGKDKYYRRNISNKSAHIYSLDLTSFTSQITNQIKGSFLKDKKRVYTLNREQIRIIETLCKEYFNKLRDRFTSTDKFRSTFLQNRSDLFSVKVESTGGVDVFARIKTIRTKVMKELGEELYNQLKDSGLEKPKRLKNRTIGFERTNPETKKKYMVGGLAEVGHFRRRSIAEQRTGSYLRQLDIHARAITKTTGTTTGPIAKLIAELDNRDNLRALKKIKMRIVPVTEQGKIINNKQSHEEKNLISDLSSTIRKFIDNTDWANFESSSTPIQKVRGKIETSAVKAGFTIKGKKTKVKVDRPYKVEKESKTTVALSSSSDAPSVTTEIEEVKEKAATNWSSLIPIINSKLPPTVIGNMVSPKLVNRTGTFANSVRVSHVETTPQGFPSLVYDYDHDPYDVFDPYVGASPWNTPERDPRRLAEMSIREVVAQLAEERFYLRRA